MEYLTNIEKITLKDFLTWAKKKNISLKESYKYGLQNIGKLINNCLEINLPNLTLFTLSSENIQRKSVSNIFQVIYDDFSLFFEKIINEKLVKINVIGSKKNLPIKILNLINHSESKTKNNNILNLNLAFNYGFKEEIKNVFNKILIDRDIDLSNEENIKNLFYLKNIPDPDILIRTGGEKRLSNFIMYNLAYTEIFFINTLWPDFSNNELNKIIDEYKNISRRYGL